MGCRLFENGSSGRFTILAPYVSLEASGLPPISKSVEEIGMANRNGICAQFRF
jgi:hypothetical protein